LLYRVQSFSGSNNETTNYREKIKALKAVVFCLHNSEIQVERTEKQARLLRPLEKYAHAVDSLNTGGSFEWLDSKNVKSLKYGKYIFFYILRYPF